ncbi:MAG: short chain dehydrogenase [Deltaproteobacteria bacterium]|nr:short chain dehydrogenase [Deltaproteobacteria bacterium]
MRILIVGASGTIGKAIVEELSSRHEVITAGRTSGDVRLDITDVNSIEAAFKGLGVCHAVVSATGKVVFAPFEEMGAKEYQVGLENKLMGQVNLVLVGRKFVADGGSFTLTTGVLDHDPIRMGTSASMVNGAINAFVMAAAIEMPRGQRINVVSPGVIEEALGSYASYFRGFEPVSAARAARGYAKSVEGAQTGRVIKIL